MSDCPTPAKMGFSTRGEAKCEAKRVARRYSLGGQLRPYRCPCGRWHLTHLSGADARRDRRRRRANARDAA